MNKLQGKIWVFGNNVDTDQILPGYAMAENFSALFQYAMAGSNVADFAQRVKPGDMIVAGKNFGCGSSREQAPVALKEAGVSLIIAESFARIFRRNAINIGLPVMTADNLGILQSGDQVEVDIAQGVVKANDQVIWGKGLSENVLKTIAAGGLINRVRQELGVISSK